MTDTLNKPETGSDSRPEPTGTADETGRRKLFPWPLVVGIGLVAVVSATCSVGPTIQDDEGGSDAAAPNTSAVAPSQSSPIVIGGPGDTTRPTTSNASAPTAPRSTAPPTPVPFGANWQTLTGPLQVAVTSARSDGSGVRVAIQGRNDDDTAFAWTNRVQVTAPLPTGGYVTCQPVGPAVGGPRQVSIPARSAEEVPYTCFAPASDTVEISVRLYGGPPLKFAGPVG